MKKRELLERIEDLERRLAAVEQRTMNERLVAALSSPRQAVHSLEQAPCSLACQRRPGLRTPGERGRSTLVGTLDARRARQSCAMHKRTSSLAASL